MTIPHKHGAGNIQILQGLQRSMKQLEFLITGDTRVVFLHRVDFANLLFDVVHDLGRLRERGLNVQVPLVQTRSIWGSLAVYETESSKIRARVQWIQTWTNEQVK